MRAPSDPRSCGERSENLALFWNHHKTPDNHFAAKYARACGNLSAGLSTVDAQPLHSSRSEREK